MTTSQLSGDDFPAARVDALLARINDNDLGSVATTRQLLAQLLVAADAGIRCILGDHESADAQIAKLERRLATWESLGTATVGKVQQFLAGQMPDEEAIRLGFMRAPNTDVEARFSTLLEVLRER